MVLQLALTSVNSSIRELPWDVATSLGYSRKLLSTWAGLVLVSYDVVSWDGPTFFWPGFKGGKCVYISLFVLKCLNTTDPKQEAIDDWVCVKQKTACLRHTIQYYQEHSIQIVWEEVFRARHTPNLYSLKGRLKRMQWASALLQNYFKSILRDFETPVWNSVLLSDSLCLMLMKHSSFMLQAWKPIITDPQTVFCWNKSSKTN